jgi:ethanolamine utilization cobalamin adenosyltransferase
MEKIIKVKEETFDNIIKGSINHVKHGHSMNKKYDALFRGLNKLKFISCETKRIAIKQFKAIDIIEEDGKKYFKLEFI